MTTELSVVYPCTKDTKVEPYIIFLAIVQTIGASVYLVMTPITLRVFYMRLDRYQPNEPIVLNILVSLCLCFPISIPIRLTDGICHSISRVICMVAIYLIRVTDFVAVFSMLFFTLERYLRLFKPLLHRKYITKKSINYGILFIWCLGVLVLMIDAIVGRSTNKSYLLSKVSCYFNTVLKPVYGFVTILLYQILPLFLLIGFNMAFFVKLNKIKTSLNNQKRIAYGDVDYFADEEPSKSANIKRDPDQPKRHYADLNKTRNWKKEDYEASYVFIVVCVCYTLLVGPIALCDTVDFLLTITKDNYDTLSLITAKKVSVGLLAFYPLVISALYLFMARELFEDLLFFIGLKKTRDDQSSFTSTPQLDAQQTVDHLYNT